MIIIGIIGTIVIESILSREHFASFVQSMMVAPRKFYLGQKSISNVKVKAAEFLTKKFGILHDDPDPPNSIFNMQ